MPLYRRLPKRGFNNKRFAPAYITINVSDLEKFDNGAEVNAKTIAEMGIISVPKVNDGIKILGNGELSKPLTIKANKIVLDAGTVEVTGDIEGSGQIKGMTVEGCSGCGTGGSGQVLNCV